MIDTLVACLDKLDAEAARAEDGLPERYLVATLHRPFNVDSPEAARCWSRRCTKWRTWRR